MAMIVRRAGTLATRRARAAIGRLLASSNHAVTMVKSVRSSRAKIVAVRQAPVQAARRPSEFQSRRPSAARDRDDARPAGRFSDRKFGDKKPYTPREGGGEKRPYTPRGEGFRKTATVRVAIGPLARGRRAMATVPVVIGLRENLAVTRSFRAVRPIGARARILVTGPIVVEIAAIQSRGRSARTRRA